MGQVIVGYGSEDFLRMIFDGLVSRNDSVLTHKMHYGYYSQYLAGRGVRLLTFKMIGEGHEFRFDIEDCIRQYKKYKPKVLLITSPNNPTGNTISLPDLKRILKIVLPKTLVILDQAYYGFDKGYNDDNFLALLKQYPNLVFSRTFSKLYALAGLRIGFALCGRNVKRMIRYQDSYLGMSRILEEVAVAALDSKSYYKNLSSIYIKDRELFLKKVNQLRNFKAYKSKANFVLIKISPRMLKAFNRKVAKSSVVISKSVGDSFARISLDPAKYTKAFVEMLSRIDKI